MAVEAYMGLELMLAREVPSSEPALINIGTFNGGSANNIIADYAKITLSSRTQNDELSKVMDKRIEEICNKTAELYGGSAKVTVTKFLPYVDCNPIMTECMRKTAVRLLGEENILPRKRTMSGEDFSFISRKKPSVMFRLGIGKNVEESPIPPLHSSEFSVDEDCLKYSIDLFVNFVTDYQNGIIF
ncbi:MAG: peptidase dimerization domain-containing protein, partial [Clostridia bacterium]|nr:peptidase dimerization domain-containing protein [Clostridia bacterium]